jgi:hypothetical protein
MSIISNAIFEGLSSIRKIRAKMLEKWIRATLPKIADTILDHSLVNGASKPGESNSYLSGKNFSLAITDVIIQKAQAVPQNLAQLSTMIDSVINANPDLIPADLRRSMQLFIVEAQQASNKVGQLKTEFELYHDQVEKWFDSMMERLTGYYKRYASKITFIIAIVASFALNIDSINIAQYLYANKDAREKLAVAAYAAPGDSAYIAKVNQMQTKTTIDTTTNSSDSIQTIVKTVKHEINTIDSTKKYLLTFIPIGWNTKAEFNIFKSQHGVNSKQKTTTCDGWLWTLFFISKFFGLMITVFAVSMGAPFWFDMLNKVANLRSSLKPESVTAKSQKKA